MSLVGLSWVTVVMVVAWRFRRPAHRLAGSRAAIAIRPDQAGLLDRLGRYLRTRFQRPDDSALDRRLGRAVALSVPLLPVQPFLAVLVGGLAWVLPWWRRRRTERAEAEAVVDELPWLAGLIRLGVGAGFPVGRALAEAAARGAGPASSAVLGAVRRTEQGMSLADAVDGLRPVLGEPGRPLVAALVAAIRHGAPVGPALESAAADLRLRARRRAEVRARKVPVRMLFPLVTCILPAFILLSVVPMVGDALSQLELDL
ncbi:MAG: type II secretion system F family protein [Acidimicrobiia bacterium]|nr:type II secretion system F family protein [Actinomycetota bacterium]MBL6924127.1 type II secretion system F family protein [Acidimicrobiia bacterium]MBL6926283.1 type II secretion system F family protein [Acidimicrobiia bacterium]